MIPQINPAVGLMDESVIREMTRVAEDLGAINLAQGFPEHPIAEPVLEAAQRALRDGANRYTRTWGDPRLRREISIFLERRFGLRFDPESEIVVTCGASEAIMASLLTFLSPGDGAVIPEPIYENYLPGVRLAGARPAILPVDPFDGSWQPARLQDCLSGARAMVLNTPTNPTGKVWSHDELQEVAEQIGRSEAVLVTDETYAFLLGEGQRHIPPATLAALRPRTVTIGSFSKTYAVTGWRVGFAAAPEPLMASIRKVHDFLTVCAPAAFQLALVEALQLPDAYYEEVGRSYRARYEILSTGMRQAGWKVNRPQGGYFMLADLRDLGIEDDRAWAVRLARERGVAGVPGSAFLWDAMPRPDGDAPDRRGRFLRLSFGKAESAIREAVQRLRAGPPAGRNAC
jgi:aminotransferase